MEENNRQEPYQGWKEIIPIIFKSIIIAIIIAIILISIPILTFYF